MSTIKTTNITHGSNSGTSNLVLDSAGNATINGDLSLSATHNLTVADGNLVVGTAAHGIDFSAQTATAATGATTGTELLDHYETGTWTPTCWGKDSNPTQSYVEQFGRYTRIGNIVFWAFRIQLANSGISAGSGNRTGVDGLPFTPTTGGGETMINSVGYIYMKGSFNTGSTAEPTHCWYGDPGSGGKLVFTDLNSGYNFTNANTWTNYTYCCATGNFWV